MKYIVWYEADITNDLCTGDPEVTTYSLPWFDSPYLDIKGNGFVYGIKLGDAL